MKKQKIASVILTFAMLSSMALSGCKSEGSTSISLQGYQPPKVSTSATEPENQFEPERPTVADGVPCVMEEFAEESDKYQARGDVTLTIEQVKNANGNAVRCTNRTDNWNGINFPIDFFVGNNIAIQTRCRCSGGTVRISLQFDNMGNTTYSNLMDIKDCSADFVETKVTCSVPEGVENVFVYLEGVDTSDIICDYMYVTCDGEYKDPSKVEKAEIADTSNYESLKELYKDDFLLGCCVPRNMIEVEESEPYRKLLLAQFSSFTCENEMKPDSILDGETTLADPAKYNEAPAVHFDACKATMDYAQANGIKMRFHTLVWHSQTPDWFFYENYDVNGKLASRELMLKRLENYIKAVFEYINTNYPDLFYACDVANECVDDSYNMRKSHWTETIGEDFLNYAFEYARKYAGKNIKLFYNDYNEYVAKKRDKIIEVLKPIAEAGNIDGMGLQSHISNPVSMEDYIGSLKKYADELKVTIHVTELDVNAQKASGNPDYDQGVYYQTLFTELLKAKAEGYDIESVTIWGLTDLGSWRSAQTPVLFTGNLEAKLAFQGVVNAKKGGEIEKPADYVEPPKEDDPFDDNFENDKFAGSARAAVNLKVVSEGAYEGEKCLAVTGASETWDGYTVDLSRFMGKKIKFSFAVKSTAAKTSFSADIADLWPHIVEVDTSSGEWVPVEGVLDMTSNKWVLPSGDTVEVPADMSNLVLYFETFDCTDDFYVDAFHIELAS